MMKNCLIITLIALIGFYSCNTKTSTENESLVSRQESSVIATVDSQQAKELLEEEKEIILLDVRTPEEFAAGHLEGARNIDFQAADFNQQLQDLDPDLKYMVYCAIGGRSGKSAKLMQEKGFKRVYNVSEGFSELSNLGLPVAK